MIITKTQLLACYLCYLIESSMQDIHTQPRVSLCNVTIISLPVIDCAVLVLTRLPCPAQSTSCPSCRKPLPRCVLCLLHMSAGPSKWKDSGEAFSIPWLVTTRASFSVAIRLMFHSNMPFLSFPSQVPQTYPTLLASGSPGVRHVGTGVMRPILQSGSSQSTVPSNRENFPCTATPMSNAPGLLCTDYCLG